LFNSKLNGRKLGFNTPLRLRNKVPFVVVMKSKLLCTPFMTIPC